MEARIEYRCPTELEVEDVRSLLKRSHLPTEGIDELGPNLIAAIVAGRVVGASGLEIHGSDGLLRSVVVADEWRGRGLGGELVRRTIDSATRQGLGNVYLLTEGAAEYFEAYGFTSIDRSAVTGHVVESAEFSHLCPSSAVAMILHLDGNVKERVEGGDDTGSQR